MTTSFLPDLNVWLANVHALHDQHLVAAKWFDSVPGEQRIVFCRETQAGLLRLLTTRAVMGEYVTTQRRAWSILDDLMLGYNIALEPEHAACWKVFRARTERDEVSPKYWADAYRAAFALTAGLQLVTFDRALAASVPGALLLTL